MGPERDPSLGHLRGHPLDRGIHAIEVDDQRRRVDPRPRRVG
jgi:hypothetical protein